MDIGVRAEPGLIGCVDRSNTTALSGWIADTARPDRLETVICHDGSGRTVEFRAWHVREDVCGNLGVHGRFGFVIPFSALGHLDSSITVRDRNGLALTNGLDISIPSASASASAVETTTIFLHVPKTAGTSLQTSIIAALPPPERLFVYPPPFGLDLDEFIALPAAQLRAARLIAGHTYFGLHRFLAQGARYATFLRDPMARLRSHVAHHAGAGTMFRREGRAVSLSAIVNEGDDGEFDNLLVRSIAGLSSGERRLGDIGEADVDLAMANIERHFAMVGFVETIEADAARFAALLGVSFAGMRADNATARGDWFEQTDRGIDWDRVEHRNRFDRLFYDRVWASGPSPVAKARGASGETDVFGNPERQAPPAAGDSASPLAPSVIHAARVRGDCRV